MIASKWIQLSRDMAQLRLRVYGKKATYLETVDMCAQDVAPLAQNVADNEGIHR